jgi:hypothetical protein
MRTSYPMIDDITVPEGRRDVDPKTVAALAESMRDIGLLHPIVVTYPPDHSTVNLVAGRHRLEAARSLGWVCIDAFNAVELSDAQRELIEIDENLYRSELGPAEVASALSRRKATYEAMHPETKLGANQHEGRVRQNGEPTADRFTKDTADKTGMSERTVQRNAERGRKIGEDNLRKIGGTSLDKPGELDALAKLDPATRNDLCNRAEGGESVSAKALNEHKQPANQRKGRYATIVSHRAVLANAEPKSVSSPSTSLRPAANILSQ